IRALDDPMAQTVIELPETLPGERNFLVQFKASNQWVHISDISDTTAENLDTVWQSRVAGLEGDRIVGIQWEGDVLGSLKTGEPGYLVGGLDETKFFTLGTKDLPKGAKALTVQVGDMKINVWVDAETRQLYYSISDLPETLQQHPEILKNLVRSTDLPSAI